MTTGLVVMIPVTVSEREGEEPIWGYVPAEIIGIEGSNYVCREIESDKEWTVPMEVLERD